MVHVVVVGYIVDHYCFIFDRRVVHVVVVGYIADQYCLMFDRGVVHVIVASYIVDHYCLTEECVILLWLAILLTITVYV